MFDIVNPGVLHECFYSGDTDTNRNTPLGNEVKKFVGNFSAV